MALPTLITPDGYERKGQYLIKKHGYTPMEVHNSRVSMLEAQLNQMEQRLRMAETEARLAKGRERKLLASLIEESGIYSRARDILRYLLEEVNNDGNKT